MPLSLTLITPPAVEPVNVILAKQQCQIDAGFTDDDNLFAMYITAAREYVEKYMNRAIFNQTWTRTLDHFPLWWSPDGTVNPSYRNDWPYYSDFWNRITIDVPMPSTESVVSIKYTDQNNVVQTLASASYNVDLTSTPARIVPALGTYWPSEMTYIPGSVVITFVAGSYGDGETINNCPNTIIMAILLLVNDFYENRLPVADDKTLKRVEGMLDQYVVTCTNFRPS